MVEWSCFASSIGGLTEDDFMVRRLSQSAESKAVMDLSRKDSLRDVKIVVCYTLELIMKICAKVFQSTLSYHMNKLFERD